MMKDFFLEKFEFDFYATEMCIDQIEKQEDVVSDFVKKSISHIINVHHIWNARLIEKKPESELWDVLPIHFLTQLNRQNHRETIDYIEKFELGEKVKYHSSEGVRLNKMDIDILYHILNHSSYHRGQIVLDLKRQNLLFPSFDFITFK